MAYVFNALGDYLRRGKDDKQQGGDLQRGTAGAPPPTAAAQDLAKKAETSSETGNSAGRFAAMQNAPVGSISARLAQPAQQKAQSWTTQAQDVANKAETAGQTKISETYKPITSADISGVETGDTAATGRVSAALKPTPMEFQPTQVTAPTLDTTSMVRSGLSGVQSALQAKGGRYTPGMAAMDATAFMANPAAYRALQAQLGGLQSGMQATERGITGEGDAVGVHERLANLASEKSTGIKSETEKAVKDRIAEYLATRGVKATEAAVSKQSQAESDYHDTIQNYLVQAGIPNNVAHAQANAAGKSGTWNTDYIAPEQGELNLANILGIAPQQSSYQYQTFSPDFGALDAYIQTSRDEAAKKIAAAAQAEQQGTTPPNYVGVNTQGTPVVTSPTEIDVYPTNQPTPGGPARVETDVNFPAPPVAMSPTETDVNAPADWFFNEGLVPW